MGSQMGHQEGRMGRTGEAELEIGFRPPVDGFKKFSVDADRCRYPEEDEVGTSKEGGTIVGDDRMPVEVSIPNNSPLPSSDRSPAKNS